MEETKKSNDFMPLMINNESHLSKYLLRFKDIIPFKIIKRRPTTLIEFMNKRDKNFSCFKCKDNCFTCKNLFPFSNFLYVNNFRLSLNSNVSCTSSHCIYVIFCNSCSVFYVGKSQTPIRSRFALHRFHLNSEINSSTLPITRHLKLCSNCDFYFTIIYQEKTFNNFNLCAAENYFINLLSPPLNF